MTLKNDNFKAVFVEISQKWCLNYQNQRFLRRWRNHLVKISDFWEGNRLKSRDNRLKSFERNIKNRVDAWFFRLKSSENLARIS